MAKLTLRNRILAYYRKRPGQHIASGEIQRIVVEQTKYTPANATRRLRELAEDGLLKVEYRKSHAFYWYEPTLYQVQSRRVVIDGVVTVIYPD